MSFGGGVTDKDIVIFTRQFSTMIDAGLPLVQALEILSTQVENKFLAKTLEAIKSDVEAGSTYADALKKHPKVFSDLYANMVAAGESGGILDTILNRLAAYIEKAMKVRKVKGGHGLPPRCHIYSCNMYCSYHDFRCPYICQNVFSYGWDTPLAYTLCYETEQFSGRLGRPFDRTGDSRFYYSVQTNQEDRKRPGNY